MYKGKLPHYHPIIIACFVKGNDYLAASGVGLLIPRVQWGQPPPQQGPHATPPTQ